jgi:uncharacterized protein (UPF0335 family)
MLTEMVTAESAEAKLRRYIAQIHELDAHSAELDRMRRAVYLAAKADGLATRAIKAAARSEKPAAAYLEAIGIPDPELLLERASFQELLFGSEKFPSEWLEDEMAKHMGDEIG